MTFESCFEHGYADTPHGTPFGDGGHYGELQEFIDRIYEDVPEDACLRRLDILSLGETYDLPHELQELLMLLPSGAYARVPLCTQLNSVISSHGWSTTFGTVE